MSKLSKIRQPPRLPEAARAEPESRRWGCHRMDV